mmetsp:Transcript_15447/g.33378  ORF Transcript_15447/g.33378 Transcript_15447/m.33378 type:complete len:228 (+) Transcript_15447:700-1383(+)
MNTARLILYWWRIISRHRRSAHAGRRYTLRRNSKHWVESDAHGVECTHTSHHLVGLKHHHHWIKTLLVLKELCKKSVLIHSHSTVAGVVVALLSIALVSSVAIGSVLFTSIATLVLFVVPISLLLLHPHHHRRVHPHRIRLKRHNSIHSHHHWVHHSKHIHVHKASHAVDQVEHISAVLHHVDLILLHIPLILTFVNLRSRLVVVGLVLNVATFYVVGDGAIHGRLV